MQTLPLIIHLFISLWSLINGVDEAELVFAGDAMMHQAQINAARTPDGTYDFSECFDQIAPYVMSADFAVVNLETPVYKAPYSGYPCFNSPASYLDALADAGFDLFLTANNHCLDRRDAGLRATIDSLDARHLLHIGTYKNQAARDSLCPLIRDINGIKIAFLNYTYGTNGISVQTDAVVNLIDTVAMKADIEKAKAAQPDIIIACVHWGIEYQLFQHRQQEQVAQFLNDQGVRLIIGGHPHVVQPVIFSEGRLTVYSLGNFISGMKTTDTRGGMLLRVKLRRESDGEVQIVDPTYRLVYTEPATANHNFRLVYPDASDDARADAFSRSARKVLNSRNINVPEK